MKRGEYSGDNHYMRKYSELAKEHGRRISGDNNGLRKHPERAARGDNNGLRKYPEAAKEGGRKRKGKIRSENQIKNIVAGQARRWRSGKPPKTEEKVMGFLKELGLEYIFQHPVDSYVADFFIPEFNLIIEADGDYWHNLPATKENDRLKDMAYKEHRYILLRLTENNIYNNKDFCLEQIYNTISGCEDIESDGCIISG
jgi:very-short-patch-repair endonuclease